MSTRKESVSILATPNYMEETESDFDDNESVSEDENISIAAYPEDSDYSDDIDAQPSEDAIISKDNIFEYSINSERSNRRSPALNLFTAQEGLPKHVASRISTPFDCFKILITRDIIDQILTSTNTVLPIAEEELWLWTAANLYLGISKSKNASIAEMFSPEFGLPFLQKCKFNYQYLLI